MEIRPTKVSKWDVKSVADRIEKVLLNVSHFSLRDKAILCAKAALDIDNKDIDNKDTPFDPVISIMKCPCLFCDKLIEPLSSCNECENCFCNDKCREEWHEQNGVSHDYDKPLEE